MTTAQFKISPSRLAAGIMKKWLADNWWMLAIAPTVSLMLAVMGDLRFLFVALIMIFVVIPPVMFIVYFYYGMTPAARYSILLHRVTADTAGLHIIYEAEDENTSPPRPELIGWADIAETRLDNDNLYIHLRKPRYSLVIIPVDKLSSDNTSTDINTSAAPMSVAREWLDFSQKSIQSLA